MMGARIWRIWHMVCIDRTPPKNQSGFNRLVSAESCRTSSCVYTEKERSSETLVVSRVGGHRGGVVWCGVVWRGVVWCGVVWCGVVWCERVSV